MAGGRSGRLRYVSSDEPGIARNVAGKRFRYVEPSGKSVRDAKTLERIHDLVIPPAWKKVWICRDRWGHLQATGIDARGRKQYLYHPAWRALQEKAKFDHCIEFAERLPTLRRRAASDLRRRGLPREKVLAAIVRLLDTTLIRVGNEEYRRQNGSFGLTTLRDRHAKVGAKAINLSFRGKSGVEHEIDIEDARLAKTVKRCQELPGQPLFQYRDERGKPHDIKSSDVNRYLQRVTGCDFTAKDFRTWAAIRAIAEALGRYGDVASPAEAEGHLRSAVKEVARKLGNTIAVCRNCYIHPAIFDAYQDGSFARAFSGQKIDCSVPQRGLSMTEKRLLRLLKSKGRR